MIRIAFLRRCCSALAVASLTCPSAAAPVGRVEFVPIVDEASDVEIRAIARAAEIVDVVLHSDCFETFIASRQLLQTNGRTPEQVASHLQRLTGTVPVAFYFRCLEGSPNCSSPTSAVAYRQPPDRTVFINRAYYNAQLRDFDVYELAGSLAHEGIGHALGGYEHSYDWTPLRDWSVPYSISGASHKNDDAFQHCRNPLGFAPGEVAERP